jgi:DAK2 domain fusion protein YloV
LEVENPQTELAGNKGVADEAKFSPNGRTPETALDPAWNKACNGGAFRQALYASAEWLEQHTEAINALNVYPVPDGDTGTNMSRTMLAAVEELKNHATSDLTVDQVGKRFSDAALMGARGNSGVILSQIIRGLADGLHGKEQFTAQDLANGLVKAKEMAYRAVIKPVEGTMLTVVREVSEAAVAAAHEHNNMLYVLTRAVDAARESVARTPTLLATLREAGVVDAGGHGVYVLLEGALKHIKGEKLIKTQLNEVEKVKPKIAASASDEQAMHEGDAFGYCTNFMLYTREAVAFEQVREKLIDMGQSAVIVGDNRMIKVHIHTEDPGAVLSYATSLGSLDQIKLDNMQVQHERDFLKKDNPKAIPEEPAVEETAETLAGVAIVAVASGEGLSQTFKQAGAAYVVQGGQTMNPSTQDLVQAVKKVPGESVIILPNNKNIIMVAQQVAALPTGKKVVVVPTTTIPQGVTALLSFNYAEDFEDNIARMKESLSQVQTGEVTRAARSATVNGITLTEGQWVGLLDDELVLAAESKEDTVWQLLEKMEAADHEILTFYYGQDVSEPEAEIMQTQVQARYPRLSVELVWGGQPHYHYIISVE